MSFFKSTLLVAFLAISTSVFAASSENSPLYIGINGANYEITNTDKAGNETSTTYDGYMVNMGYDFNNYFAIEAMAGRSSDSDGSTANTSSRIDYTAGLYLRLNFRFDKVTLSLLAGRAQTSVENRIGNTSSTSSETGFSSGIGLDFYGTKDLALSLKALMLYAKDQPDGSETVVSSTTLGITYYFDTPKIRSRY